MGPYPAYPDDAEVPEGMAAFDFHVKAASDIRAAGNEFFKKVTACTVSELGSGHLVHHHVCVPRSVLHAQSAQYHNDVMHMILLTYSVNQSIHIPSPQARCVKNGTYSWYSVILAGEPSVAMC